MTTVQKFLLIILGAHLVLIVFFGAFKFEKVTIALYSGMWIGIGLALFLLARASVVTRIKVIAGIFIVQAVIFAILDFWAHMTDLFMEEAGFMAIGVWGGILVGTLLNTIKDLEDRVARLEKQPTSTGEPDQNA